MILLRDHSFQTAWYHFFWPINHQQIFWNIPFLKEKMYMLLELMYMYMFTDTIVFRDERNVKISSFLSAKTLSKAYCVIVYEG